jgi:hypothetical protein
MNPCRAASRHSPKEDGLSLPPGAEAVFFGGCATNQSRTGPALKKPQALAHCGFRVRKWTVYESVPAPVTQS